MNSRHGWMLPKTIGKGVFFSFILILAVPGAHGEVLFSDSFDSCDGSGWDFGSHSGTYASSGCLDGGCCGEQTLAAGTCQKAVFWSEDINYSGEELYVKAWWKFPTDFRFGGPDACGSDDFKAIIIRTSTNENRCFLNFRTQTPTSAELAFICENTDQGWSTGSGQVITPDGLWHSVEVHVTRQTAGGHVQVWFDDSKFIDTAKHICWPGACPAVQTVKFGAYQNWESPGDQTFFLDSASISTTDIEDVADGCVNQPDSVLFCDDFEDGTLGFWADDLNAQGGSLHVSSNDPLAGTFFARMSHAAGTASTAWMAHFFADHPLLSGTGSKETDLYAQLQVRFSSVAALASDTTKLTITAAFDSWTAGYPGPNSWSPFYTTLFASTDGTLNMETHSKTSGASVWRQYPQNLGSPVTVQDNQWHSIQYHLKLNTPGASDGVLEYWVDGEQKAAYSDVNFRDSNTQFGWNHLMLSPHQDPVTLSHSQDWDLVVTSTEFITDPGSLPPVTGLHRTDKIAP